MGVGVEVGVGVIVGVGVGVGFGVEVEDEVGDGVGVAEGLEITSSVLLTGSRLTIFLRKPILVTGVEGLTVADSVATASTKFASA